MFGLTRPHNASQQSRRPLSTPAVWHLLLPANDQLTELTSRSMILDMKSWRRVRRLRNSLVQNAAIRRAEIFTLLCWSFFFFDSPSIRVCFWRVHKSPSGWDARWPLSISAWKSHRLKGNAHVFRPLMSLFTQASVNWRVVALNLSNVPCCEGPHDDTL